MTNVYQIEEIKIFKDNGTLGLSIVGGGSVVCHPFGVDEPGIFICKIVPNGPASHTNLRVGDRLLKVNDVDVTHATHYEAVDEMKRNLNEVTLTIRHDPQPNGLLEVVLTKSYPEEILGLHLHGGLGNKCVNPMDTTDEGIFIIDIIPGSLAHKSGKLKIGTRIIEINGHHVLGVRLDEAHKLLLKSLDKVHMVVCDGFNDRNDEIKDDFNEEKCTKSTDFPSPPKLNFNEKNTTDTRATFLSANIDISSNSYGGSIPIVQEEYICVIEESKSRFRDSYPGITSSVANCSDTNIVQLKTEEASKSASNTPSKPTLKHKSISEVMTKKENTNDTPNANESTRTLKDKIKFFETVKDTKKPKERGRFSFLKEHEIQNIKQEEAKKLLQMSRDENVLRSRMDFGDDITNRDYETLFSN